MHTEDHANDQIKAAATGIGSAAAILGKIFDWWPQAAVENFIDVATAAALGVAAAFYAGRRLYAAYKASQEA